MTKTLPNGDIQFSTRTEMLTYVVGFLVTRLAGAVALFSAVCLSVNL